MKISIIVPVYNSSLYLKDCLNSLLNQTINDIEIIAIDDNSIDDSLNILKDLAKIIQLIILNTMMKLHTI